MTRPEIGALVHPGGAAVGALSRCTTYLCGRAAAYTVDGPGRPWPIPVCAHHLADRIMELSVRGVAPAVAQLPQENRP